MRVEVLVWINDKNRGRYLGRHMDHLADSIAKLSQGRENWYIGREGIPVYDSSGGKCTVFHTVLICESVFGCRSCGQLTSAEHVVMIWTGVVVTFAVHSPGSTLAYA